jgi:hypothetical protein
MEKFDAVILAAGRLHAHDAELAGVEIKALVRVGDTTPLAAIVGAMRPSRRVARIIVVAPGDVHGSLPDVDEWVAEGKTGEENILAGLRTAHTRRAIVSASDAPFVNVDHVDDFLERVPDDADFAYPVYKSEEFLSEFPNGRSRFARVGGVQWTGGSICVMNVKLALANAAFIRRGFVARKSQLAMASLLGVDCVMRYAIGRLEIGDIERRIGRLTGGRAVAVRGAHPALAMDCDSATDIDYVRQRQHEHGLHR